MNTHAPTHADAPQVMLSPQTFPHRKGDVEMQAVGRSVSVLSLPPPLPPPQAPHSPPKSSHHNDVLNNEAIVQETDAGKLIARFFYINRGLLGLASVFSLFTTTWTAAIDLSISLVPSPNWEYIRATSLNVTGEVDDVQEIFEKCIRDKYSTCSQNNAREFEALRVSQLQAQNKATVRQVKLDSRSIGTRLIQIEIAMQDAVQSGRGLPFHVPQNATMCSLEMQERLLAIAGGDAQADRENAKDAINRLAQEGIETVTTLALFLVDYSQYNHEYFFRDLQVKFDAELNGLDVIPGAIDLGISRIFNATDLLLACLGVDAFNLCPAGANFPELIDDEIIQKAKEQIELLQEQLRLFQDTINMLIDVLDRRTDTMRKMWQLIRDASRILGIVFDRILDGRGIDLNNVDFTLGIDLLPDGLDLNLPQLERLLSIDSVFGRLTTPRDFQKAVTAAVQEAREQVQALVEDVQDKLRDVIALEDYDPPKYPGHIVGYEALALDFMARSNELSGRARVAVDGVDTTQDFVPEEAELIIESLPTKNITDDLTPVNIDPSSIFVPKIDWDRLLFWAMIIFLNFWIIESGLKGFDMFQDFKKHWDISSVNVPHADLTKHKQLEEEAPEPGRLEKILRIVSHPIVNALVNGVVYGLIFYVFLLIYLAEYSHYYKHCVISANGTAIARGLVSPLLKNHATLEGDILNAGNHTLFQSQKKRECSAAARASQKIQAEHHADLVRHTHAHNDRLKDINEIMSCIDIGKLDGIAPDMYEVVSSLRPIDIALEDAITSCEWEDCNVECAKEAITEQLELSVNQQACMVEWFIHASILRVLVAAMIYISLNLARKRVFRALTYFCWKHLRPGSVNVLLTNGHFVDKDTIDKEVKKVESQLFWRGCLQLLQAILICTPIIFTGVFLRIHVQVNDLYKPQWLESTE